MKKINLILIICLLFGCFGACAESEKKYYYNFEAFTGSADGQSAPEGWLVQNAQSGDTGLYPVHTKFGTSIRMTSTSKAHFQMRHNVSPAITGTFSLEMKLLFKDKNVNRVIQIRDSAMANVISFATNGNISIAGSTKGTYETDVWYNVKILFSTEKKQGIAFVDNGSTLVYNSFTASNIPQLGSFYITHDGTPAATAYTYVDNIMLSTETSDIDLVASDSFLFDDFQGSANGLTAPSGFYLTNTAEGKTRVDAADNSCGGKSLMFTSDCTKSFELRHDLASLTTPHNITTDIKFDDLNPTMRSFGLRGKTDSGVTEIFSVLRFISSTQTIELSVGGPASTGNSIGSFTTGVWYTVSLQTDPENRKYSVTITGDDGSVVTGEAYFPSTLGTLVLYEFLIQPPGNGVSVTYLDNISISAPAAPSLLYSSPSNGSEGIAPNTGIHLLFNKPLNINSFSNAVFNGEYVSGTDFSFKSASECVFTPSSLLDINTDYTLDLSGVTDSAGQALDASVTFKTADSYYYISSLAFNTDKTASVITEAYCNEPLNAVMLYTLTEKATGRLIEIQSKDVSVTPELTVSTISPSAEISDSVCVNAFLWDNLSSMNVVKPHISHNSAPVELTDTNEPYTAEVSFDTGALKIRGKADAGASVTAAVLKPGKTPSDLTDGNLADAVAYIGETVCSENGLYGFGCTLSGASGTFGLLINCGSGAEWIANAAEYYSPEDITNFLDALNAENADYDTLISENIGMLRLDLTDYSETDKAKVAEYLSSNAPYSSIIDFAKTFNTGVAINMLNAASTGEQAQAILTKYAQYFSIDKLPVYNTYSALADKTPVFSAVADISNFNTVKDVTDALTAYSILHTVKSPVNISDITSALKENAEFIGISTSEWLSLKNPLKVNSALSGNLYKNMTELKNAFNGAVKAQKNVESGSGGKGGSGGGAPSSPVQGTSVSPVTVSRPSPAPSAKPSENKSFTDLGSVPWAEESIEYLAEKGIVNGKADGIFSPDDYVTREEFVKMLTEAFEITESSGANNFEDADMGGWYYKYIVSAYSSGIVTGISDSLFGIGENITRQDMAVMAHRTASYSGLTLSHSASAVFEDSSDIAPYALPCVQAMADSGIINGTGNNRFSPLDLATRAQAAKIIYSLLMIKGE